MIKFLKNKKVKIMLIAIIVLILAGVVLVIALNGGKDKTDKGDAGQDVIVHEKEENAKEEVGETGLIESDSEDGPSLKEENIVDYSGGEKQESSKNAEDSNKDDSNKNDSGKGDSNKDDTSKDEGTKDTGSWGAFY